MKLPPELFGKQYVMAATSVSRHFVTLGMFIIDQFEFLDEEGKETVKTLDPQVLNLVRTINNTTNECIYTDRGRGHLCCNWCSNLVGSIQ